MVCPLLKKLDIESGSEAPSWPLSYGEFLGLLGIESDWPPSYERGQLWDPIDGWTGRFPTVESDLPPPPRPSFLPDFIPPGSFTFDTEYVQHKLATERCLICTELGHDTAGCSYSRRVPKDAHVGPSCDLVCIRCGSPFLGFCCDEDEGRAILKECLTCGTYGDHWPRECPLNKRFFNADLPRGVFCLDIPRSASAPGNDEQKEYVEPASVKINAFKDDEPMVDYESEDEETSTPSKFSIVKGRSKPLWVSTSTVKETEIDTDGDKGAYRETNEKWSPDLVKWMASFKTIYRSDGGFTYSVRQE